MNKFALFVGALTIAAVAVLAHGCGGKPTCNPSDCVTGCCDADGLCQLGTSNNACGTAGLACFACGPTDICQGGVCAPLSRPNQGDGGTASDPAYQACLQSCTGCCLPNGECATGNDVSACGTGGSCKHCSGDQTCQFGVCRDTSCYTCINMEGQCNTTGSSTSACGYGGVTCKVCPSGTTCQSGVCVGATCDGCRDAEGLCAPGNAKSQCGTGGALCQKCPSTQSCVDGQCVTPPPDAGNCKSNAVACLLNNECCSGWCNSASGTCQTPDAGTTCNSSTCPNGCCMGSVCLSGTTTSACGSGGATCLTCSTGQVCQASLGSGATCTSADAGSSACGPFGQSCTSSGQCCSLDCVSGQCQPTAAGGLTCASLGASCSGNSACCSGLCSGGKCVSNSTGDAPACTPDAGAGFNVCTSYTTKPSTASCDPCVANVCLMDTYCCSTRWDSACATEAVENCGGRCP